MRTLLFNHPSLIRFKKISGRTWVLLAAGAASLLLLALCLAIFAMYRLWNGGSAWLDQQVRSVATADATARQHLDALRPKVDQPLRVAEDALSRVAPEAHQSLQALGPQVQDAVNRGRDTLAVVAPATVARLEAQASGLLAPLGTIADRVRASDVPGDDIDVVPRHFDMTRTGYSLVNGRRTLSYSGPVRFEEALSFHRQPLIEAGFAERILNSSPAAFKAEYRRGEQTLLLDVAAQRETASEVRIAEQ